MKIPFFSKNSESKVKPEVLPDQSRRSFLLKGVAGATALSGVLGYEALQDPVLREKIFLGVSGYFGEKGLEAQLEKDQKLFFDIYGIELNLRSIEEMNKEAQEKNAIEATRLTLIQKIASEVYTRELNKDGKGKTISLDTINGEQRKMIEKIAMDYYKQNSFYFVDTNFSRVLSNFEKLQCIEHLKDVFSLYPVEYIRKLKIKTINAGRDRMMWSDEKKELERVFDGGYAVAANKKTKTERSVYVDFTPSDITSKVWERQNMFTNISHELSHQKDNESTDDDRHKMLQAWESFSRKLGATEYFGDYWKQIVGRPVGFFRSYGAKNPDEDRATISEALFAAGQALEDMCKKDTILKAKVEAIKQEYFEMDTRFTKDYFDLLGTHNPRFNN